MGAGVGAQLNLLDGPAMAVDELLPRKAGIGRQEGGDGLVVRVAAVADLGDLDGPVHGQAVHDADAQINDFHSLLFPSLALCRAPHSLPAMGQAHQWPGAISLREHSASAQALVA